MSTIITTIKPFGDTQNAGVGHANYRKNQDAARHEGRSLDMSNCCCYCGKKCLGGKLFAYLTNIGEFAEMAEREAREIPKGGCNDDLGLYPVGADCARILKKHAVPLYNQNNERV